MDRVGRQGLGIMTRQGLVIGVVMMVGHRHLGVFVISNIEFSALEVLSLEHFVGKPWNV